MQSLLLLAAERTPGLRQDPKPMVLQTALEDFYVRYTLLVCLERQESRPFTLHALHSHIQDLFNEYGVQIMSPELRPRSGGAEGGGQEGLVCRARIPRSVSNRALGSTADLTAYSCGGSGFNACAGALLRQSRDRAFHLAA